MPDFKLLPMGISDFRRIRLENYYYVDKTAWIPKFEQVSSFLFFCRPRRFGKTLMLSVMESYYDCKQQQDWDRLFSGLWIHEHPTAERGQFQVLKADATDEEATRQWQEAEAQIRQYGQGSRVALMSRDTQLHLIIVQFRGPRLLRLDDVEKD